MTMPSTETKHGLVVVKRPTGVALIMFDAAGRYNVVGPPTIAELGRVIDYIASDSSIKAVVGISAKPESFIIGADLHEVRKASSADVLRELTRSGQNVLNKMACFTKPFVLAINGACLGGGLEIALAAHVRIATKNKITIFGLPETRLGLIPGCGGTQRLPRLVGLKAALDLILSAEAISAERALEMGLIDELVDADNLIERAEQRALELAGSKSWLEQIKQNHTIIETEELDAAGSCLKDLTWQKAEKLLAISQRVTRVRTRGNYPAPIEAVKVIRTGLTQGFKAGLAAEAESFANLAVGDVATNLITLFFTTNLAKSTSQALVQRYPGNEVKTLGIIGAGTMGRGLAQLAAGHGLNVILKTAPDRVDSVNERLNQLCQRSTPSGAEPPVGLAAESAQSSNNISDNITVVTTADGLASADLIIECIVEDAQLKSKTISEVIKTTRDDCVMASNTSALPIADLSRSLARSENFLGAHFFHPVDRMPLVELIVHPGTSKAALARAVDLSLKLDKTPLVVKDRPGFLINRLLTVYFFELGRLADEQTPLNWVEDAMLEFGMPMGPLQLMDEIGLDLAFSVARVVEEGLGKRLRSPESFKRGCAMGMKGKRSNVGFYLWENSDRKIRINPDMLDKLGAIISEKKYDEPEKKRITDRMILTMLDEAARCLEEKIVARPREIDLALILGIGFPAFRGGIFKYADQRGLQNLLPELEKIYAFSQEAGSAGERCVSALLRNYAKQGRGFYWLAATKED